MAPALVATTLFSLHVLFFLSSSLAWGRVTIDSNVVAGSFRYMGSTGVSAQQMYLGTDTKLYLLDKVGVWLFQPRHQSLLTLQVERNDNFTVADHPAWACELDLTNMKLRAME